jgi:hypothetical protein
LIRVLKSVLAAIPDMVLAVLFLITWINPRLIPAISVESMVLVMILEFVVIHSAGFMGAVVVGDAARPTKIKATLGFGAFYLLFFIAFAFAFRSWWPMLAFLLLMGNRLFSVLLSDNLTMTQKSMVIAEWAMAVAFYILCVAATIIVPVEPMGANIQLSTGGSGEWELRPYKALAAGVFYFALMSMAKFFIVLKANPR